MPYFRVPFVLGPAVAAVYSVVASRVYGQESSPGPKQPPIIGVAHIGLKTGGLKAADHFYGQVLGCDPDLTRAEPMEFNPVTKPCCSPMTP